MDAIIDAILQLFQKALQYLYEILVTVILETLVNFLNDVVDYFKSLGMKREKQFGFLMKTDATQKNPISSIIPEELRGKGIIEGVYDKEKDQIDSIRYIGGNGVDEGIEDFMKDDPIVILN